MRRREMIAAVLLLTGIGLYAYQTYLKDPTLEPQYTYHVVNKYPHDSEAFTQGLVYYNGFFYEGTGLRGESSLRIVEPITGKNIKRINLSPEFFGEGVTILDGLVYQLTWREHTGFIYDLELNQVGTWSIANEGWGLTENGTHLIMSDGTSTLSIIDPENLAVTDTIAITSQGEDITRINELEYIEGYVYANIWQTEQIVIIDLVTGYVVSWIDLTGLKDQLDYINNIDVLNGIAYDQETGRIFVTGKKWPNLFEIKLIPK
jgi:glutamine cyclotransferase